jgi:hypothetical protein
MIAKEHIYNLRTNLQDVGSLLGKSTDQHLMYMLDEARASLASQKIDKKVNIVQMMQFADFKTRATSSDEIGTVGNSRVLALDIPAPVSHLKGIAIFTIGPTDGKSSYTQISYSRLRTIQGRKYTSKTPMWFILGSTIFLINVKSTGGVRARVRGVWDEPYRIIQAKGEYKYLTPFEWEYPLTNKDAKTVYQIALAGDLGWGDDAAQAIAARQRERANSANRDKVLARDAQVR